jgi:hypothetical protein
VHSAIESDFNLLNVLKLVSSVACCVLENRKNILIWFSCKMLAWTISVPPRFVEVNIYCLAVYYQIWNWNLLVPNFFVSLEFQITILGSQQLSYMFNELLEAFIFLDKDGDGKLKRKDFILSLNDSYHQEKSPGHVTSRRFSIVALPLNSLLLSI